MDEDKPQGTDRHARAMLDLLHGLASPLFSPTPHKEKPSSTPVLSCQLPVSRDSGASPPSLSQRLSRHQINSLFARDIAKASPRSRTPRNSKSPLQAANHAAFSSTPSHIEQRQVSVRLNAARHGARVDQVDSGRADKAQVKSPARPHPNSYTISQSRQSPWEKHVVIGPSGHESRRQSSRMRESEQGGDDEGVQADLATLQNDLHIVKYQLEQQRSAYGDLLVRLEEETERRISLEKRLHEELLHSSQLEWKLHAEAFMNSSAPDQSEGEEHHQILQGAHVSVGEQLGGLERSIESLEAQMTRFDVQLREFCDRQSLRTKNDQFTESAQRKVLTCDLERLEVNAIKGNESCRTCTYPWNDLKESLECIVLEQRWMKRDVERIADWFLDEFELCVNLAERMIFVYGIHVRRFQHTSCNIHYISEDLEAAEQDNARLRNMLNFLICRLETRDGSLKRAQEKRLSPKKELN
eukprot:763340-Hanusia_phi.AAC.4